MAKFDPSVIDFVKALARANAARDIARLQNAGEHDKQQRKTVQRR